jgi:hypothetical protein
METGHFQGRDGKASNGVDEGVDEGVTEHA